jgi:DNA invertase Pin-like site-specific DNA recombinase
MKVGLYLRVSTEDQTTENQGLVLREICETNGWEIFDTYVDHGVSGSKGRDKRPEFNRLIKDMTRRKFQKVMVWDVSRLGRSLTHLVEFLNEVHSVGCDLYIHQSGLDTQTPSGKMMFQMIGIFSEFERSMISQRVKTGLQRVRKSGKKLGRPSTSPEVIERIKELLNLGWSYTPISKELDVSRMTISRIARQT